MAKVDFNPLHWASNGLNAINGGWGKDYDLIEGTSKNGGDRNAQKGSLLGIGATDAGQPNRLVGTGDKNAAQDTGNNLTYPGTDYAAANAAAAQRTQEQRERDITVGGIDRGISGYQSALGRLDGELRNGYNSLEDSYNKGLSRLNQQYSNGMGALATQRGDTRDAFARTSDDINNNARNNYQSLMQMLGRAGAGRSSAAENVVPYAVSTDASKSRGEQANLYGLNLRDIDDKERLAKESFANNKEDLSAQRNTNRANLERDIAGRRSDYETNLANLQGQREQALGGSWESARNASQGAWDRSQAALNSLNDIANKYRNPYSVKDVNVQKANLKNYAFDAEGVDASDPDGTGTDTDTSANYLNQIRDEEKRKKQQVA